MQCSVGFTPSTPGANQVTAAYGGDSSFLTSSGAATVQAVKRSSATSVSCAPASVIAGSPTTCTATVADNDAGTGQRPSGSVSFSGDHGGSFGSPSSCTLPSSGALSCSVTFTPSFAGSNKVSATYGGDAVHGTSSGSATVDASNKRASATAVSCSPGSVTMGVATTCTAALADPGPTTGTPTGTVSFSTPAAGTFGSSGSCSVASGSTQCSVTFTPGSVGTSTVTAAYGGDSVYAG